MTLEVDMGKYKSVRVPLDVAERLIVDVSKRLNVESKDVMEALRIVRNFDEFYEFQQKKFKDYVVPDKDISDMIRGAVVVDSMKLIKEGNKKDVVITFDRRVREDVLEESLKSLGFEVIVKRSDLKQLLVKQA
ncbi:MAG: hypothetical protein RXN88_00720 [Acidilobus sp.]|uniref:hypothetical protein n=1 Tax=Acidilobus sp. 7A TaxID=1577685 RepID=UPI000E3C7D3E|nr:hypothetical protein [Acidilobus sp. 7A]